LLRIRATATEQRWKQAQRYERLFWEKAADRIASGSAGQLSWYEWRASEMEKRLSLHLREDQKKEAKVLEIGSGPIGIVSFMKWGGRYTIDPLEDFYKLNPVLSHLRNPAVHYGQGKGEKLPFEDGFFSLVILDNVLDHTHEASKVLNEIYRVLSKNGILYLAVNLHTSWGAFLHNIMSRLLIDRGHPYTFTVKSIRDFVRRHQFNVLSESINDYQQARVQDLKSTALKDKIKGCTGLSEFIYYAVSSKNGSE
jgi:ubiquinone/menaquinone biosynthesis C-methylase UbiE